MNLYLCLVNILKPDCPVTNTNQGALLWTKHVQNNIHKLSGNKSWAKTLLGGATQQRVSLGYGHTHTRRHMIGRRRGREFQMMGGMEAEGVEIQAVEVPSP